MKKYLVVIVTLILTLSGCDPMSQTPTMEDVVDGPNSTDTLISPEIETENVDNVLLGTWYKINDSSMENTISLTFKDEEYVSYFETTNRTITWGGIYKDYVYEVKENKLIFTYQPKLVIKEETFSFESLFEVKEGVLEIENFSIDGYHYFILKMTKE